MTEEFVERLGFDRAPDVGATLLADLELSGRVAVVTGAARGLGLAIARRLAGLGAHVALVDVDGSAAGAVADDLAGSFGTRTIGLQGDVTDHESFAGTVQTAVQTLGPLAIFVNNVGGGGPAGPFPDTPWETIEPSLRLNLLSQMYGTHIALSHFVEQRRGVIINIASSGGQQALPNLAVYGGCKAGVIGFSRSVAHDLVGLGIRINVICPGTILSPQLQDRARQAGEQDIAPVQYSLATTPLGRASTADEVANVVAFLSSDAASAVHGAVYSVGGG